MKIKLQLLGLLVFCMIYNSCKHHSAEPTVTNSYFLSEIRPVFFEHLNFNSPSKIAEIPAFLVEFTNTYKDLEENYRKGVYTSASDKNNMRLASMYYSFGITAI